MPPPPFSRVALSYAEFDRAEPVAVLPSVNERSSSYIRGMERLVEVAQQLSLVRTLEGVMETVRHAARELTGADGATFVLRDEDCCYYADEEAIGPLWKGKRFPLRNCISGWVMENREPVVIEDIYSDPRIPIDAYRPTFVQSLAMVPIRTSAPIGAIGNYWATPHKATAEQVRLLAALADSTSITLENIRLYSELEQRMREAQDGVRMRDEFLSIASHELCTPLTALQLQLQSLQGYVSKTDAVEPKIGQRLSLATASTRRLALLIDGLLDVSRIRSGRLVLGFQNFDLVHATRSVIDTIDELAKRAGSDIRLLAEGEVHGTWDRSRIEQILTNLLANALKYGFGKPIEVRVNKVGAGARVEVVDHGMGIERTELNRIFDRFERAVPANHFGGLGLGLYVVRELVRAHGGSIGVASEPNVGSTFTVDLPLNQTGESAAQ